MSDKAEPTKQNTGRTGVGPIVSSAHLASGAMPELSEMEYALIVASSGMQRWIVRCTDASGLEGLTAMEVQVLHSVNHRGREKTLADLCLVLNIEDTHLVNYAIKKLAEQKLVKTGKRGKEKTVAVTDAGRKACEAYHQTREALLVESVLALGLDPDEVSKAARLLRALSGQYDQAARSAASL